MLTQFIGFSMNNLATILDLFKYIPSNFNLVKSFFLSFSDLHVADGVVISLSTSRVHELRGTTDSLSIGDIDCEWIIDLAESIGSEDTILSYLYVEFVNYQKSKKQKGLTVFKTLSCSVDQFTYLKDNSKLFNRLHSAGQLEVLVTASGDEKRIHIFQ
jgi:hypothetical protein